MRKSFMVMIVAVAVILVVSGCSKGNSDSKGTKSDYPTKPITIVVPFAPGGSTDLAGRIIGNTMSKYLPKNQSIVIENIPGGASSIGVANVFSAKPDGYRYVFTTNSPLVIFPHMEDAPYEINNFDPIAHIAALPQGLLVMNDSPWNTYEEWIKHVKDNPDTFTVGVTAIGNTTHLAIESLHKAADIQTKIVPFSGGAAVLTALMGGHIDAAVVSPADVDPATMRGIFNFGSTKVGAYKDIPTLKDKGLDISVETEYGILAPKGLPEDVKTIFGEALEKALKDPDLIEQFNKINLTIVYLDAEGYGKKLNDSYETYGELIKSIGLGK